MVEKKGKKKIIYLFVFDWDFSNTWKQISSKNTSIIVQRAQNYV